MFTMMNEARLGVGLQGYAVAEPPTRTRVAYARTACRAARVTGVARTRTGRPIR
jgi:alkylation response protein AidB-like acyl-CoA dehydrogenase